MEPTMVSVVIAWVMKFIFNKYIWKYNKDIGCFTDMQLALYVINNYSYEKAKSGKNIF